jgi:hypothetical protein
MMRVMVAPRSQRGLQRQELFAAVGETAGLFLIFIAAFTGRDVLPDAVKQLLIVLTFAVGIPGTLAGLWIARRGLVQPQGRIARLAVAAWMVFAGLYSMIHVVS